MNDERWTVVDRLLGAALEREPHERAAYLREACGGDEALRLDVESLITHASSGVGVLSTPAVALPNGIGSAGTSMLGRHVGPYVIAAHLGAGGMGEVYRARDSKLGRDVAMKILPRVFTSDPDRRARLDREGRLLAALNHPHIGAIYGLEELDGTPALILELVEGDTLADRIAKGPIPLNETLTIARQIADALDAAHEKGIVHRDLKPANIKITSGIVKVLDFGLAKAAGGDGSGQDLTQSPTVTIGGTHGGVILGTAPYMSPEQARGTALDKRTDVWAFGCVLYEMLTGRVAFPGNTLSDTIVAILDREPEWSALPAATPAPIRRLLLRCLDKDAKRRLRDIGDARTEIDDVLRGTAILASPTAATAGASLSEVRAASAAVRRRRAAVVVAVLIAVLAGGVGVYLATRNGPPPPPSETTFSLKDAEAVPLTTIGNATLPALAPSGEWVAYVRRDGDSDSLWIRQTATGEDRLIARSKPGVRIVGVTVTPDERYVDFIEWSGEAKGNLLRVPVNDEAAPHLLVEDVHTPVAWSPTEPWRMAFIRRGTELIVADFHGLRETILATQTDLPPEAQFVVTRQPRGSGQRLAWSPDGNVIATTAERTGPLTGYWIFVSVADKADKKVHFVELTPSGNGNWLDNSSLVVNRSDSPGNPPGFWKLSYPGGVASPLTKDLSAYDGISLTRNRDSFATTKTDARVDIWVGDGNALGGLKEIPPSGAVLPILGHGAGGSWINDRFWYSARSGSSRVASALSSDFRQAGKILDAEAPTGPSDGSAVVYVSRAPKTNNELWRADSDGRRPKRLAVEANWPTVTRDDDSVIFSAPLKGRFNRPYIVPISGATPARPIADITAITPDESFDGKRLAYVSVDQTRRSVFVCDLPDCLNPHGPLEMPGLVNSGDKGGRIRWAPGDKSIAYVRGDYPRQNIWVQPLDQSTPRRLTDFKDDRMILDFAWSRDGQHFAAVRARISSDIVLFKNLWRRP